MIFNKEELIKSFEYLSKYYQKILLVDLKKDIIYPIKVDKKEWVEMSAENSLSKALEKFAQSKNCHPYNSEEFIKFTNIKSLRKNKSPMSLHYRKFIKDSYHQVVLEFIPIGHNKGYIMVKDLTKMLESFIF